MFHLCRIYIDIIYIAGSSGGGGGGGWGGDRELQETPDTVFITGLGESIVEEDLLAHFGSIGVIKVNYVCLQRLSNVFDIIHLSVLVIY